MAGGTLVTRLDRLRRRLFGFVYGLLATAGVAAVLVPSAFSQQVISSALYLAWIACLIGGGILSLFGAVLKRPLAELAGIVLLVTGFAAYAAALISRVSRTAGAVLVVALVGAVVLLLALRYLEIIRAAQIGRRTRR